MEKFNKDFNNFIGVRSEILLKNKDYSDLNKNAIRVFNMILKTTTQDQENLLMELEEICAEQQSIAESLMYQLGMKDLLKMLGI